MMVVATRINGTDPVSNIQVDEGLLVGVALDRRVTLSLLRVA